MHVSPRGDHSHRTGPLELELQAVIVSCLVWVLGTKLGSSGRAVGFIEFEIAWNDRHRTFMNWSM